MKSFFVYIAQYILLPLILMSVHAGLFQLTAVFFCLFLMTLVSDLKTHLSRLAPPKLEIALDQITGIGPIPPAIHPVTAESIRRGFRVPEGSLADEIRSGRVTGILPNKAWPEPTGFSELELRGCRNSNLTGQEEEHHPTGSLARRSLEIINQECELEGLLKKVPELVVRFAHVRRALLLGCPGFTSLATDMPEKKAPYDA
jgi:hypothetical protein